MIDPHSTAHQLVGAVFNTRWRLARLIGEGGMGAVYEAQSMRGEGIRAIKVLHPEFVAEEPILQRFVAEAQAVKNLQHPNVSQIFEAARAEDGTPYLVMELLQGAPLSDFMRPGQGMPQSQAGPLMLGVLAALTLAHSRGIVHRDLKPDNIFMVADGRGGHTPKVLDFGIAKVMDVAGGMGSKTKTGVLLGTPGYMSPEQIKNSKGVDARADLWSVGIIFYELLSGKEAFTADNEFTRLTMVLTQEVRPIGEVAPALSAWTSFFQRALSKEPSGRFQSATDMAQGVSAMLTGGQPGGRPTSAPGAQGTVALSMGSPQMQQPYSHSQPHSNAPAGQNQPQLQHQGPTTLGTGAGAGGSYPPANAQSYPGPNSYPAPQSQAVSISYQSSPPPSGASGPNTHISPGRTGNTLQTGAANNPAVELMRPPPVGVPWWVVGAVGFATFMVGVLIGKFVL